MSIVPVTLIRLVLPVLVVISSISCSPSATEKSSESLKNKGFQTSPAGNLLRKSNGAEPQTLDPHLAEGVPAGNILRDLYEGLTIEAPDGAIIPGVAESWSVDDSGTRYTFRIRDSAHWSNGTKLTAADFVYSFRRALDPDTLSRYASILYPIKNAEAVNRGSQPIDQLGVYVTAANVLVIELEAPTPYFLSLLNHTMAYPVHRETIESFGGQFTRPGNNVSNGAYKLDSWLVQSHISLERNEHYWDNADTNIDEVVYFAIENPDAVLKRYRANEIDLTQEAPYRQLDWIQANIPDEYVVSPYLGAYYYGFNMVKAPFKDLPELRLALALSVDRSIITEKLTGSGEIAAFSFVPPVSGYVPQQTEWAEWSQQERNAEARRLYAAAGYDEANPLQVEILYNTQQNHKQLAIAISSMWKQNLGVKTTLLNQEWKVFLQTRTDQANTEIFRSGWIGDYDDAYTFLQLLVSDNEQNDSGYKNAEYDELLVFASRETNLTKRQEYMQQAEALMLKDMPVMPIYFYVSKHLVKPWVKGLTPNIMDHVYTKDLHLVY
ncbi:MAG: peptide ABC transporter substrate-binding protein [Gammaproteobacteria bacterium]|nr:peptide ABC transporter substrate-binding protein [Gammaproteobacteria bacterium]